jgi:hypothetical protein
MANKILPIFNDPVQLEVRDHVLKIEKKEISQSKKEIQVLDKDINTIRRQIEIIEDQSLRQNNGLFLLKLCITYLSLILIPLLLSMKEMVSWTFFKIYMIALSIIFGIVVFFNIRSVWKRNYNRYSLRNFIAKPPPAAPEKKEEFTSSGTDTQHANVNIQTRNMPNRDKRMEHFKPVESSLAFRNRL